MTINDDPEHVEIEQTQCPQCQTEIPVYPGFVTWCEKCEWNLNPIEPLSPPTLFTNLSETIGSKFGNSLFDSLLTDENLNPKMTFSKFMGFIIATVVHLITLFFLLLGLFLIFRFWPNIAAIIFGLLFIGYAYVIFPWPSKFKSTTIQREKYPKLFKLCDEIASSLGIDTDYAIEITNAFSASLGLYGWKQKKVLRIGYPLFYILRPQERVALISHEFAHVVNGDALRSLYVVGATNSLLKWIEIFLPPTEFRRVGEASCIAAILSLPFRGILYFLSYFMWRSSQRAEYLADYLASRVSSTEAMISTLMQLHFQSSLRLSAQSMILSQETDQNLFLNFRNSIKEIPQREIERLTRTQKLDISRLNMTHPPTPFRVAFLEARPILDSAVQLSYEDSSKIDSELKHLEEPIQQSIISWFRQIL